MASIKSTDTRLSICLRNVIVIPFRFFVSQTIEYYVMFLRVSLSASTVNNFLRSSTFVIFATYSIYLCIAICVKVHLINLIVQLYFRFNLISGFKAKTLLCYFFTGRVHLSLHAHYKHLFCFDRWLIRPHQLTQNIHHTKFMK